MSDYPPSESYSHEEVQNPGYPPENPGNPAVYPAQEPYGFQAQPVQKPPPGASSALYSIDPTEQPLPEQPSFFPQIVGKNFKVIGSRC